MLAATLLGLALKLAVVLPAVDLDSAAGAPAGEAGLLERPLAKTVPALIQRLAVQPIPLRVRCDFSACLDRPSVLAFLLALPATIRLDPFSFPLSREGDGSLRVPSGPGVSARLPLAPKTPIRRISANLKRIVPFRAELAAFSHVSSPRPSTPAQQLSSARAADSSQRERREKIGHVVFNFRFSTFEIPERVSSFVAVGARAAPQGGR
jgi:hypothetical protein